LYRSQLVIVQDLEITHMIIKKLERILFHIQLVLNVKLRLIHRVQDLATTKLIKVLLKTLLGDLRLTQIVNAV